MAPVPYLAKDGLQIVVLPGGGWKGRRTASIPGIRRILNPVYKHLAAAAEKPSKSVHRMLSSAGNPTLSNRAAIFAALKYVLEVEIQMHSISVA